MDAQRQPRTQRGRFVARRRTMPVQVRMTASLRQRIDAYAAARCVDRSDAIRHLIRLSLRRLKR